MDENARLAYQLAILQRAILAEEQAASGPTETPVPCPDSSAAEQLGESMGVDMFQRRDDDALHARNAGTRERDASTTMPHPRPCVADVPDNITGETGLDDSFTVDSTNGESSREVLEIELSGALYKGLGLHLAQRATRDGARVFVERCAMLSLCVCVCLCVRVYVCVCVFVCVRGA